MEEIELLKAAMAVALADKELRRSEMGLLEGLAKRAGVGPASFAAMVEAAREDESFADNILIQSKANARSVVRPKWSGFDGTKRSFPNGSRAWVSGS